MICDIQSLKKYLESNKINNTSIIPIMAVIRIEIERRNIKSEYKYLNMFCDWCLHPALSKSLVPIDIMQEFIYGLSIHDDLQLSNTREFNNKLVDRLFDEMKKLFIIIDVNCSFFSDKREIADVFYLILCIIKERPLIIDIKYIRSRNRKIEEYDKLILFCSNILQKHHIDLMPNKLSAYLDISENNAFYWKLELLNIETDICIIIEYDNYNFIL